MPLVNYCSLRRLVFAIGWAWLAAVGAVAGTAPPDGTDWPQWRGVRRDGVWRETGVLEKFTGETIPLRWRVPVGAGYTGPTVAAGRVYLMDYTKATSSERVFCLDWKTGAVLWEISYACSYERFTYEAGPRASVNPRRAGLCARGGGQSPLRRCGDGKSPVEAGSVNRIPDQDAEVGHRSASDHRG